MKKIMLFFAVATILAACNNDNEVLNETQYITEFKADFGADTRMTATADNGLKFAWEDDEVLYVFQANAPSVSYKEYQYDATAGTFKAKYAGDAMEACTEYFAVNYIKDYVEPFTIVEGKIQFKSYLYTGVGDDVTKIPLISDVFTATADGTITAMHHTVGVVEVPVKLAAGSEYSTLDNLGFRFSEGYSSQDFIATPESPYFKEATNAEAKNTWANMGEKVLSTTEATSIFIPVLPGEYTNPGLNYSYNSVGAQLSLNGTLTVECGEVTLMPVQTLTLD